MKLATAALLTLGAITSAHGTVITFEEVGLAPVAMVNTPGSLVQAGSRLTDQYLGLGALFTSVGGYAAVVDHSPIPSATPSPPAVLGGTSADGTLNYAAPITVTFVKPGDASTLGTTNFVKVLGDWFPLNTGSITMNAFDINGALLGEDIALDVGTIGTGAALEFSSSVGIHRVVLSGTSGTVGFDNFEFGPISFSSSSVPTPGSASLFLVSLFLASAARYMRRSR